MRGSCPDRGRHVQLPLCRGRYHGCVGSFKVGAQVTSNCAGQPTHLSCSLPPSSCTTYTHPSGPAPPPPLRSDIGGSKEQIDKMREVVEMPMLHPEKFVTLGIDPPKGVLMYGPPGTGERALVACAPFYCEGGE